MPSRHSQSDARTEMGRNLARLLFDYKLRDLMNLSPGEKARLQAQFPRLNQAEFDDVVAQVIDAKQYQQERVGWQAVPHDVAVLIFVALTWLVNLRIGIITGVAALVLLESLFQFYFHRPLYRYLSLLVWLTYPAYILLAYALFQQGYPWVWILLIVVLAWGGSFLLGILARLPVRLILEAKAKDQKGVARRK